MACVGRTEGIKSSCSGPTPTTPEFAFGGRMDTLVSEWLSLRTFGDGVALDTAPTMLMWREFTFGVENLLACLQQFLILFLRFPEEKRGPPM